MQRKVTLTLVAAMVGVLAACASAPTRFYTMSPVVQAPSIVAKTQPLYIELAPVSVPERLMRPQLVLRSDSARIEILEQDRWSAPFNDELRDALAAQLAGRLGAIDVTHGGRPANAPIYRIVVTLSQFDAVRGGAVDAQLSWTALRSDQRGGANSTACQLHLNEATTGDDAAASVQAIQRVVSHLAQAIAKDVQAQSEGAAHSCSP